MCHYVLVIMPADGVEKLGPLQRRLERWTQLDRHRGLLSLLRAWEGAWSAGRLAVFHTNPGRCACGWYFPPAARGEAEDDRLRREEERLFKKYQAEGWSFAKIERALTDWRAATQRRAERDSKRLFVSDLVADVADAVGDIGVVPIWSELGDSGEVRLGEELASRELRGEDEYQLGARLEIDEVRRVRRVTVKRD